MEPEEPLGVISPNNESGLILILTALSLSFVLVSFAIRLYVRLPPRLWKSDDNILTAATALSCVQTSLVFYEVHLGLGNRKVIENNDEASNRIKKYYFANDFLYLVVLFFSKAAVGSLFLRLTRQRGHVRWIWSILGLCAAWIVLSVLLISIGCSWEKTFTVPFGRWLAVGITDSLTELAFVVMAGFLVKGLRMSKVQKGTVVFAFGLRLLAVPALAIRLYYLNPSTLADNHSLALSLAVVCTQVQLGYGVMAASVTVLKPFMVVYEKPPGSTDYLTGRNKTYGNATNDSEHVSFKMKPVARSTEVSEKRAVGGATTTDPTQPYAAYHATAAASGREKDHDSIHSHDSRRLIIERKTDWSVRYEEAESQKSATSETGESV
ncbi:hypothetical protein A1O3_02005 [Capronia epimyces CBS 606.96]|uniref:Rhodopsin domain-containing protein n=1 Tax=Capronia epimyces CBS 606.96 TaxID=1182542 RepID=W9YI67_9EURO|nr:uncharacterized protein A1O3_02005 [Capronia epimyces CBS 606.96]EXJ88941.1 hypothetical protein A1O3_02005 [Capronia epimyces CBS 606.96]